eukprot:727584-Prymnesium_polylepis.2
MSRQYCNSNSLGRLVMSTGCETCELTCRVVFAAAHLPPVAYNARVWSCDKSQARPTASRTHSHRGRKPARL